MSKFETLTISPVSHNAKTIELGRNCNLKTTTTKITFKTLVRPHRLTTLTHNITKSSQQNKTNNKIKQTLNALLFNSNTKPENRFCYNTLGKLIMSTKNYSEICQILIIIPLCLSESQSLLFQKTGREKKQSARMEKRTICNGGNGRLKGRFRGHRR